MLSSRTGSYPLSMSLFIGLFAGFACSPASDDTGGEGDGPGTGGATGDGDAATGGIFGDGDMGTGGLSGDGDLPTGGVTGDGDQPTGGAAGDGDAGTGGNPSVLAFVCPAGSDAMTVDDISTKTPQSVTVPIPPADGWFLEGPVWIGTALFVSQIREYGVPQPSHILKYTPGGAFETFIADAGTNGLAVDGARRLVGANHAIGGIVAYSPTSPAAPPMTIVDSYEGSRFNSPNDLTIRSDGTIYFTDPDWQCMGCGHQSVQGVYRVPPGGMPERLTVSQSKPNGIALSPDETTLYIGGDVLKAHPVNPDGSIGAAADFGTGGSDGLAVDCSGNVYATQNDGQIAVFDSAGSPKGTLAVQGARNLAFGGPQSKTLFVVGTGSSQGGMMQTIEMNIPGFPY